MKIVHLALSCFYIEGFGYQENLIPKYNKLDGHEVAIIASRQSFNTENGEPNYTDVGNYINSDGIKIKRIDYKKGLLRKLYIRLRIYGKTYNAIEEEKPDLIFMHGIQFWDMKEVIRYIKNNPECKLIADNHATYENSATNWLSKNLLHKVIWKNIIQDSLQYIDKIYCITPSTKKLAIEYYKIPEQKTEFLYLGADIIESDIQNSTETRNTVRKELKIPDDATVIISGGKLTAEKKVILLLDAVYQIKNDTLKVILFGSIGDDIRQDLNQKIERDKRIIYLGWINSTEVYKYFFASDIAIFLGTQSALWQQAIGSGLPTIFNSPEDISYLDMGGNTIFLKNANINQVKNEILQLIDIPQKLYKMKDIALKYGYNTFSYQQIAKRAISNY